MSEHTLDDLAARLEALGWRCERSDERTLLVCVRTPELRSHKIVLTVWTNGDAYLGQYNGHEIADNPITMTPEIVETFAAIRQWQASAEPAAPPAAPVVTENEDGDLQITITLDLMQLLRLRYFVEQHGELDNIFKGDRRLFEQLDAAFEAALRGADLTPEGARDGQ